MKFILNDAKVRATCVEHILNIDIAAKPIMTVEIKKFSKKRSLAQNSYYWSTVLGTISDYTGYPTTSLHDTFRENLLPTEILDVNGFKFKKLTSTTDLDTKQMMTYCEQICQFAAETIGVAVPLPNQSDFE